MRGIDPRQVVARGYDAIHETYAAWAVAPHDNLRKRYIDRVAELALLSVDAAVLDLGCGTGAHATAYLSTKWSVTGVDISPQSVAAARRWLPPVSFVVGDMASVEFRRGAFDLISAFFSLIHVPRIDHARVLQRMARWLRPGGVVLLTMGAGKGGEGIEDDWLGAPMYWSNWDRATNLQLVADGGFDIIEANDETQDEDGEPVTFLWVIARRTEASGFRESLGPSGPLSGLARADRKPHL